MADLGRFGLLAALVFALYAASAAVLAARTRRPDLAASAVRAIAAMGGMEALAAAVLASALLGRDYRLAYVASHVRDAQPWWYNLAAFWGGMEGSLLLWALVLAGYAAAVLRGLARERPRLVPGTAAVCASVSAFFLLLLVAVASPFATVPFPPADGRGMNPLLLNPWMAIHPPTLYLGFVGMTVPFAIVMAALADGGIADGGVLLARRWMLWAWYCLSMGLMFGAKWSYVVLGWGGYWAWDPVENAALMPWLVATAFLHSVMVQERRAMLGRWTVVLVILAFGLSIFGTFLTRSGVLSSIHSFTQSPLGSDFLAFLALAMLAAFGIAAWRWDALRDRRALDAPLCRESAFLFNNVLLVTMAFVVFLGTVFPIVSDALVGRRVNVGPPFFDHIISPLALLLLALMGVGPLVAWRRASPAAMSRNLQAPAAFGLVVGLGLLAAGMQAPGAVLAFALCAFVAGTIALEYARGVRLHPAHPAGGAPAAIAAVVAGNRRRYGGYTVHLGIVLVAAGVTGSSVFATQRVVTLAPGGAASVGPYRIRYDGLSQATRQGALVVTAHLRAFAGARDLGDLETSRRLYLASPEATSDVGLRTGPANDLYIILTSWTREGEATLRLLVNPLVLWIWAGGLVLTAGAVVSMLPEPRPARLPPRGAPLRELTAERSPAP
jgi:cytochrome c-type biogenesis protein CcmF